MTALSDLLKHARSKIGVDDAVARAAANGYSIDRATVYRYSNGDHPQEPPETTLLALSIGFNIPETKVRKAAGVPVGELGPYKPPTFASRLSKPQRDALDELIRTIVKVGTGDGTPPAEKSSDEGTSHGGISPTSTSGTPKAARTRSRRR